MLPAVSASLPAASIVLSDSGLDTQAFGEQVLKNSLLVQAANALDIDPALTHQTDPSLRTWYKKYNTYHKAVAKLSQMKAANTWTLGDVSRTELLNVFAGRSYWHAFFFFELILWSEGALPHD